MTIDDHGRRWPKLAYLVVRPVDDKRSSLAAGGRFYCGIGCSIVQYVMEDYSALQCDVVC